MMPSKPGFIVSLVLAASGCQFGSAGASDAGTASDSQEPSATGSCTMSGAAIGTVQVFATCSNLNSSGTAAYALSLLTTPQGSRPAVGSIFSFGSAVPALGKTYALSDSISGDSFAYVSYRDANSALWLAGDFTSSAPNNGSVGLMLTTCNGDLQDHGTLSATLKSSTSGVADVTVKCTF